MALRDRLNEDLKAAMRAGDATRRDTLRLLISALKNAEIENRGALDADAEAHVVGREVKQRKDSIEEYRRGNREDLAAREQAELDILAEYQPQQLSTDEIRALVAASIARTGAKGMADMGKVMRDVMAETKGRADGTQVNAIARELLLKTAA